MSKFLLPLSQVYLQHNGHDFMGGYGDFIMIMLAKIVSRRSVEGCRNTRQKTPKDFEIFFIFKKNIFHFLN